MIKEYKLVIHEMQNIKDNLDDTLKALSVYLLHATFNSSWIQVKLKSDKYENKNVNSNKIHMFMYDVPTNQISVRFKQKNKNLILVHDAGMNDVSRNLIHRHY